MNPSFIESQMADGREMTDGFNESIQIFEQDHQQGTMDFSTETVDFLLKPWTMALGSSRHFMGF